MAPAIIKKTNRTFLQMTTFSVLLLTFFSGYAQVGIGTLTPNSTLEVNGSMAKTVTTVTGNTTLDITHSIIVCDNGAVTITITLPTAAGISGRIYTIKRNATSSANVTIAGTINGATNLILTAAGQAETLFSDNAEWKSLSKYEASTATGWSLTGNTGTAPGTNYVGTTDAQDLVLKTNNTSRVNITSAGVTTIGDITGVNNTKIEADGTLKFEGEAEVWDDLRVSMDRGSDAAKMKEVWNNGPEIYFFNDGDVDGMSFVVQMPHSWKEGTFIYPHLHWLPSADATSKTVIWKLQYSWQNYDSSTPQLFPTFTTATNTVSGNFTKNTHLITSLTGGAGLDGLGKKISSILVCRIIRDGANDTYGDETGLLSLDIHFQIDTIGSRLEYVK